MATTALALFLIAAACSGDGEVTGDFYGSVSYNPFIGIKQSLVSNADTPVFAVRLDGELASDEVYFSLLTLENYRDGQFSASRPEVVRLETENWIRGGHEFAGPTQSIIVDVEIVRLRMEWLPSTPTPREFVSTSALEDEIRVRTEDGALRIEGGVTFEGMRYQVRSDLPQPDGAALAVGEDGHLSPVFVEAANAGETMPQVSEVTWREEPEDVDKYLGLPPQLEEGVAVLARELTRDLETSFEKGIALERWFRSPAFRYSTDVVPGHDASDLAAWLLNPKSSNYRLGYCENFATSMAVMARTLGIPSRVVLGFTPGTQQSDGTIVVRDRNAHAWVELWMPAQGWVRFDPTPRDDDANPATYQILEASLGFPITHYLDVPGV